MSSVDVTSSVPPAISAVPTSASSAAPTSAVPTSSVAPTASASASTSASVTAGTVAPTSAASPTGANPSQEASSRLSSASAEVSSIASVSGSAAASSAAASASSLSQSLAASVQSAQQITTVTQVVTRTSNGVLVTETNTLTSSLPGSGGSSSTNNTGAIAGGVVGGVVGLALVAGLLFFFLRKRRRSLRDDFDDGMFDPGRAQNRAPVDLGDDQPAPSVEPFYTPGIASTAQTESPQMSQYPRSAATTSDGGYYNNQGDVTRGPSSASTAGFAGRGAAGPMPSMPEASNYVTGAGSGSGYNAAGAAAIGAGAGAAATAGMSAKQREAYQERQRFQVANSQPTSAVPSGSTHSAYTSVPASPTEAGRQTVVSEDAGPVGDDAPFQQGGDIPPTYDSIRR